jgi:hypothetical protein
MPSTAILDALNSDPSVQRRLRFADCVFRIETGEDRWLFVLRDGKVAPAPADAAADVTVRIAPEAWTAFQQPVPPPGCHDIYAMAETGRAEVTGDFLTLFRYSYVLKDILQQLATGRMFG